MTRFHKAGLFAGVVVLALLATSSLSAQTFSVLDTFNGTNGSVSAAALVQATDGNFYGTTVYGGTNGQGSVFQLTPSGTINVIYSFCSLASCADGSQPFSAIIQGTDGNLYGTTNHAGASGYGNVFKLTLSGTLTTLHSFHDLDGAYPQGGLVQGADGNLYGTTLNGGSANWGTVYKLSTDGSHFAVLHNFVDGTDGGEPYSPPVQASDGNFYGSTWVGGGNDRGTIYKITPSGTFTTLYSFCMGGPPCPDGAFTLAPVTQGSDGNLYGVADRGGNADCDESGCGTIFQLTLGGTFTTLYTICDPSLGGGCVDGTNPISGLTQAINGTFYSNTSDGGANYSSCYDGCGAIFSVTPAGVVNTLYAFCSLSGCDDGKQPGNQAIIQGTDGIFYGTTGQGGAASLGIVYTLDAGSSSFVKPQQAAARVGSSIVILGSNLTGVSAVRFNGTPATFTVGSSNYLIATVPTATSGPIEVSTSSGALRSSKFWILP